MIDINASEASAAQRLSHNKYWLNFAQFQAKIVISCLSHVMRETEREWEEGKLLRVDKAKVAGDLGQLLTSFAATATRA